MIVEDFKVKGTSRFTELKFFLEKNIPEASFRHTPHHHVNTDTYDVSLRYNLSHTIELNKLHSKWRIEDEKNAKKNNQSLYHFFQNFPFPTS